MPPNNNNNNNNNSNNSNNNCLIAKDSSIAQKAKIYIKIYIIAKKIQFLFCRLGNVNYHHTRKDITLMGKTLAKILPNLPFNLHAKTKIVAHQHIGARTLDAKFLSMNQRLL
jgi:hypothetical protein